MMKRKGLFGSPGTTAFAEMVQGVGEPRAMTTQPVDVMQAPPVEKKPGFFGNGGVGWQIMGTIGDALREANGLEASYGPSLMRQRQMQFMQQKAEQQRQNEWQDWVKQQEYLAAHPKPVNNDTTNDYAFIESKLGPEAANQYLRSMGDPVVTVPLGNGQIYSGPRSGLATALSGGGAPTAPAKPVGKLTPIGGGSGGNVGGGFR